MLTRGSLYFTYFVYFPISYRLLSVRVFHKYHLLFVLLTFHFGCKRHREGIDDAFEGRDDAAASKKDSAAVGWLQPYSTFQNRNRSSHGSIMVQGSRKGDSAWVVAL